MSKIVLLAIVVLILSASAVAWWRSPTTPVEDAAKSEAFRERESVLGMRARGLTAQEERLKVAIAEMQRRSSELSNTLRQLHEDERKQAVERRRLVESGTPEEVMALARKLGYHPRACQ